MCLNSCLLVYQMMVKILRQVPWGRAMLFLLLVWLIFIVISIGFLRPDHQNQQQNQRISQALRDLQSLRHQREEINKLLTEYNSGLSLKQDEKDALLKSIQDKVADSSHIIANTNEPAENNGGGKPSLAYERVRRRLYMDAEEMWFFVSGQVKQLQKKAQITAPHLMPLLNKILEEGVEHKRSMVKDVDRLSEVDGYADWRLKEAVELSDLVQRRLIHLQNPENCEKSKKLLCNLNKGCGYGCQLHHAVYCLLVAYGTQRTLILRSKGWRYNRAGWEQVFRPVSDTCTDFTGHVHNWPGHADSEVVLLGIVDSVSPRPPYLPLAVPKDLAERISRLHGDPAVWWVGQFLKYLLRPQPNTVNMLKDAASKFNFQRPIVGVHIRRTDKVGTEAAFHPVDEYMEHVEEYYKQLELSKPVTTKRIYLASDDYKVFAETKKKYPEYEILGDPQIAKTAAVSTRYSDGALNGLIQDLYFLSQSDYLVCTFSSQVCRVAYEIMQSLHPDASTRFRSLDDIYYYGGQGIHRKVAVMSHRPKSPDEMDLAAGDIVGVAGNHWDGYSKGRNLRTNQVALYPSFKVDDIVEAVDFPTYTQVPLTAKPAT
ncbi:alpha-(1,6)-fucosyltransferase [Halyomorpha halys]|uniref:alpha-(1,6)-fucosyltransferase n=1 Tax=Halyomorpha halys TaxID=286706 RepID=UPI0006D4DA05|nr:alpha-(1,6)-fucosyltransferase [Halyomorpha halys]